MKAIKTSNRQPAATAEKWFFTPIASNWGLMDDTVRLTFWVTGVVFVAVNLFMAYTIVRYRHRKGREQRAEYEPEYKRLEWWLIGITSVGVAAMLAPGLFVWAKFVTVPAEATTVEALGQQWAWSFRLPGADGVLGSVDSSLISPENPFGMDANDPSMLEGKQYLLENLPDDNLQRDVYYWYYATLVMHNFIDSDWDKWNRPMRKILIRTQCKDGCAEGSWDPERPTLDRWAQGGRVFETALSTLTLEVYYRYLPLFRVKQAPSGPAAPNKMSVVIGLPNSNSPTPDKPAVSTP